MDMSGTLGLPQDALDNLGTLGKELITKVHHRLFFSDVVIFSLTFLA